MHLFLKGENRGFVFLKSLFLDLEFATDVYLFIENKKKDFTKQKKSYWKDTWEWFDMFAQES